MRSDGVLIIEGQLIIAERDHQQYFERSANAPMFLSLPLFWLMIAENVSISEILVK